MIKSDEKIYSLYVHTFPNGKVYVGITSLKPQERWGKGGKFYLAVNKNGRPYQPKIYHAIKKYGWDNTKHEIILQSKFKDEIEKQERYFITEVYHSDKNEFGYNICKGGHCVDYVSPETRKLISKAVSGENNPGYGKHFWNNGVINVMAKECPGPDFVRGSLPRSEEFKQKMKEIGADPEKRKKKIEGMRRANIHERHWWNNGIEQKHCKECPGEGWVRGQLPVPENDKRRSVSLIKGKKVWNNGVVQVYADECPGEDWKHGTLPLSEEALEAKRIKTKATILEKYGVSNINDLPTIKEGHAKMKGKGNPNFGKKWYNNGQENILSTECPEGFKPGMLPMPREIVEAHKIKTKGQRNWTNGISNKRCKECPGEGWYIGQVKKTKQINEDNK